MSGQATTPTSGAGGAGDGFRPFALDRSRTNPSGPNHSSNADSTPTLIKIDDVSPRGRERQRDGSGSDFVAPARCINPASDVNARLDTQVEVRVYPCNNNQGPGKKKYTTFTIKPEVSE
jgi:hypothetical protein